MSTYVAIAYRYGHLNDHWYIVYAGDDHGKAQALAENEQYGRGGKYGVAVFVTTDNGEGLEQIAYCPSSRETDPFMNWRIELVSRLGHLMLDYIERGRILVSNPDKPGTLHYVDVPPMPDVINEQCKLLVEQSKSMAEMYNNARERAREDAQAVVCPFCESTPVYFVEYRSEFLLTPRHEEDGTIEVDGLSGIYCIRCGGLHLTPDQIKANEAKIHLARLRHG